MIVLPKCSGSIPDFRQSIQNKNPVSGFSGTIGRFFSCTSRINRSLLFFRYAVTSSNHPSPLPKEKKCKGYNWAILERFDDKRHSSPMEKRPEHEDTGILSLLEHGPHHSSRGNSSPQLTFRASLKSAPSRLRTGRVRMPEAVQSRRVIFPLSTWGWRSTRAPAARG